MLWDQIETDPDKRALALALIERVPHSGWRERALSAASEAVFHDPGRWRRLFPNGSRAAIWFISEVSDASMKVPFLATPAPSISAVVSARLEQNGHLKPFVRTVMLFDLFHPMQAVRRMQRTARAIFECLPRSERKPSPCAIATLNLVYTVIVFVWLLDRTNGNKLTKWFTAKSLRIVGLA